MGSSGGVGEWDVCKLRARATRGGGGVVARGGGGEGGGMLKDGTG